MYNFQTFECSNESLPNSSCHSWNQNARVYSDLAPRFSVMKDNSFVFFISNLEDFRQKYPIQVKFWDFGVVGWKFTKFLMSHLNLQVNFSLNLAWLFNVKRDNFFKRNLHYFDKRSPSKCQILDFRFHQTFTLIDSFLLKVYKISAKKVQRSCVPWYWRLMQNLKEKWFVVSKLMRIW